MMKVPSLSRRSFNDIEETVGEALETEATESCEKAAIEEISLSREQILTGQSVFVDQSWQKRGVGMNSRSGHSSMIGELSKKVIDYQVKVKAGCRTCESAKRNKISPKVHKCRINHSGSSKSME